MEVVARPTLTTRDQTLHYAENELLALFSRVSCWIHLQFYSLWLERRKTKARERGAIVMVRLLAIYGGSVRMCCRASCGLCAVYSSPDVIL